MLTQDKITEIFCITDDFCRKFNEKPKNLKKLSEDSKNTTTVPCITSS
jgi:hypothetical protein